MSEIVVYGASDDLIEVDGAIVEEFAAVAIFQGDREDRGGVLAFNDGTVLKIIYDNDGMWRIRRLAAGTASYALREATNDRTDYSDRATLTGELRWVVFGTHYRAARGF